jgi:indolepyruvate ferredoxin oxidoreductase
MERHLAQSYAALASDLSNKLTAERLDASIALASAPAEIRGFGPVKALAYRETMVRMATLRAALDEVGKTIVSRADNTDRQVA